MLRVAASLALLGLGGCVLDSTLDSSGTGGRGGGGQGGSTTSFITSAGGATTTTSGSGFGGEGGQGGSPPEICGDGNRVGSEQCDDGNNLPLDGCEDCKFAAYGSCPGANPIPIVVSTGAPLTLTGNTTDAANDLPYSNGSIPNFDCDSKGDDVVFVVQTKAAGTLTIELHSMDDDFGNNGDTARLHLRTDCPTGLGSDDKIQASLAGELGCYQASGGNPFGTIKTQKWMKPGETLFIVVSGEDNADHGAFTLELGLTKCGNGVVEGLEDCDGGAMCTSGCLWANNTCGAALTGASARKVLGNHCLVLMPSAKNFYEARRACVQGGGDLASAETPVERGMLPAMPSKTWLGLQDVDHDGVWTWLSGGAATASASPWPMGLWTPGQPGGAATEPDCAYFDPTSGTVGTVTRHCQDDQDNFLCELALANP